MFQSWNSVILSQSKAGPVNANATNVQSLLPDRSILPIPGGFLQMGSLLRVTATGQLTNVATTPGTLTLALTLGGNNVWTSGPLQMSITPHTGVPLWLQILLTCYTVGQNTNASLMGQGIITSQALSLTAVADSVNTPATLLMPNTTPVVGGGFDSTISNIVNFTSQFSVNTPTTSIELQQFVLESMN